MTATMTRRNVLAAAGAAIGAGVASSISQKAMLVRPTVKRWNAERTDARVAREIAAKYGASGDMGQYTRYLVAKVHLERIRKINDRIRDENYKRTLPWIDGGTRVLSSAGYFDYVNVMRGLTDEFDEAVAEFVAHYPEYVAEAKVKLNGLFDPTEYPTHAEIGSKFQAIYRVYPFPASDDFRVSMSADEAQRVKTQIEQGVREALAVGMRDVWARMKEVVGAMAERLSSYNTTGDKVTGAFRDTLVTNVRELVDVLPSLNITDDPALDAFIDTMRSKLLVYDAQTLRDSLEARQKTATAAQDILDKMSAFV